MVSKDTLALPGYSGAHTEPEPLQPLDKSASAWRRCDLVREGGTGARVSGLAQAQLFFSDRVCKPRVAQPPVIQEGRVPKIVDLLLFTALHRQLAPPVLDHIGLFLKG